MLARSQSFGAGSIWSSLRLELAAFVSVQLMAARLVTKNLSGLGFLG